MIEVEKKRYFSFEKYCKNGGKYCGIDGWALDCDGKEVIDNKVIDKSGDTYDIDDEYFELWTVLK